MSESQYGQVTAAPPTSGMAIGSLVASITGLTILPTVGSVIGLILGYMARTQIRESRGAMSGEGLATAGIVLGWVGVGLAVVGVCVVILAIAGFGYLLSVEGVPLG